MDASNYWIWWTLGGMLTLAVLGYLLLEYLAWLERTSVLVLAHGLRFVAHGIQVELQRNHARVLVHTQRGHYRHQANSNEPAEEKSAPLHATFAAHGLRMSVSGEANANAQGRKEGKAGPAVRTLQFEHLEEHSQLQIDRVPLAVATQFDIFAKQAQLWIERLEERRAQEAQALAEAQEAQAQAELEYAQKRNPGSKSDISPDAQIALWRKNAGFSGTSSEVGLDEKGGISWYVDLDPEGRITLHADRRTIHTTLLGAELASLGGELEVSVRDDYWTEDDPKLVRFRILKGRSPDERRAWKERMEILRNQLQFQSQSQSQPAQNH